MLSIWTSLTYLMKANNHTLQPSLVYSQTGHISSNTVQPISCFTGSNSSSQLVKPADLDRLACGALHFAACGAAFGSACCIWWHGNDLSRSRWVTASLNWTVLTTYPKSSLVTGLDCWFFCPIVINCWDLKYAVQFLFYLNSVSGLKNLIWALFVIVEHHWSAMPFNIILMVLQVIVMLQT